mgnify:CR=1 FL=1
MNEINKLTCKFQNPEVEEKYLSFSWKSKSRSIKIGLYFILVIIGGSIGAEFLERSSNSNLAGFILGFLGAFILLKSSDNFRRKYFERFFAFYLSIMVPINSYINIDIYRLDYDLPTFPFLITIIILKILPISFIWASPTALICFSSAMFLLEHSKMEPQMYLFYIVIFIFLLFDKWRSEISSRIDYNKNVTIEDTRLLMYETLKRYFGETLSNQILSEKGKLSGQIKWVSVAFTDISSYSTIIENMSPKVAVKLLNQYFSRMHDIIEKHGGHILNYIGDSIMVVFGAPNDIDDHELKAVECAIEMRDTLESLNDEWDQSEFSRFWKNHGIERVTARTGIHSGSVIAGNIGSDRMLQYSTIGDVVNVASRMEKANKEFGTDICFSHEIYINLKKELHDSASLSGEVKLKGRSSPSKVYSI